MKRVIPFALLLAASVFAHPPEDETPAAGSAQERKVEMERFHAALEMLGVLHKLPVSTSPSMDQGRLQEAFDELTSTLEYLEHANAPEDVRKLSGQAHKTASLLVDRDTGVRSLLETSSVIERVWIQPQEKPARVTIARSWFGSGTLLLRIGRQDQPVNASAGFFALKINAASKPKPSLDLGSADPAYVAIPVDRLPEAETTIPLRLLCAGKEAAVLDLVFTPPPMGELSVTFTDAASGKPTPVAASCFGADNRIFVPSNALMLHEGQAPFYKPGGTRPMDTARYWPGDARQKNAFYVDGGFTLRLPAGNYTLLASKGAEYTPLSERIEVKAGDKATKRLVLKRWIDMPARGWFSGDGHVHYKRTDPSLNPRLLTWAQGEDIHLCNVLSFGDSIGRVFHQLAYGREGSLVTDDYAIIPGQEDPRTSFMGHTLAWNIQRPARFEDRYYLFDLMFDDVHRQGGLTGHAHVANEMFKVTADMAMSIPLNKTDFAEICQFGRVGERLFYEYLNLGFKMTASAGSDVPFGGTMGDSRMYVHTGAKFTPQAWFDGVKAGRTFVTLGPMIEYTVNDALPGSRLDAKPGDKLRIKARALGGPVLPRHLEIVSKGEVIRATASDASELTLEFELPVTESTWLAARCSGAHTTPIYIQSGTQRFWRLPLVKDLVAKRLDELRTLEQTTRQTTLPNRGTIKENSAAWVATIQQMQQRIAAARTIYESLQREAEKEAQSTKQP